MAISSIDVQQWVNVIFFISYSHIHRHVLFVPRGQRRLILTVTLIWQTVLRFMAARAVLFHRVYLFDIWFRGDCAFLFHSIDYLGQQFDTRFSLPFHQKDHAICEELVILKLLLSQVQMNGSLQIIMSFIEIFMLNFDLSNLI